MVVSSLCEPGTTENLREMFTRRKLDYSRVLRVGLLDYLKAWTPNHKTYSMHSITCGSQQTAYTPGRYSGARQPRKQRGNNDVAPRDDAYLHPAVDAPREGATVQRANLKAATNFPDITTSVSDKEYMRQMGADKQIEADDVHMCRVEIL